MSATRPSRSAEAARLALLARQASTTPAQRIELALRLGRQCRILAEAGRPLAVAAATDAPQPGRAAAERR